MKTILSIINLLLSFIGIALIFLFWYGLKVYRYKFICGTMQPGFVLLLALAIAFVYVNSLNPFKHIKPFNCLKCMCGWIAFILSYCFNIQFYWAYLFIGALVGGLFERLTMRYL